MDRRPTSRKVRPFIYVGARAPPKSPPSRLNRNSDDSCRTDSAIANCFTHVAPGFLKILLLLCNEWNVSRRIRLLTSFGVVRQMNIVVIP